MKKLFLLLALVGVVAVGCEELFPNEQTPERNETFITDAEDSYAIEADGGEVVVTIAANLEYNIVIPEAAQTWLSVADTRVEERIDKRIFIVAPNDTFEERSATVELTNADGEVLQTITFVQKAAIQPNLSCPNDEIWYTNGSTTEATTPTATDVFGANIVSNTYDAEKECWIIKFDGDVTTIGDCAFECCDSLTSVTIPDSVTAIGAGAFLICSSLTSVTIPDSVTEIGSAAFDGCYSLERVYISDIAAWCNISFASNPLGNLYLNNVLVTDLIIPDSVTAIGDLAFFRCNSLTSVTIPDSVTTIGDHAFAYCSSLTSITIPDSVTTIGHGAFSTCSSLTSVIIPDSVTTIGDSAFFQCFSLSSVTIPNSVTKIGDSVFEYCESLPVIDNIRYADTYLVEVVDRTLVTNSISIKEGIKFIGTHAFSGCDNLTSVTIPDSVTTIGEEAFGGCDSLTSVTIPYSVTTIGEVAFGYCSGLQEFNGKFASEDGRCLIIDGVLNSFAPAGLTEYAIPDSVTTIGRYAFSGYDSLTSVTIPDGVTTIGDKAFGCINLISVTIPASVVEIGNWAFAFCDSLTDVFCKATIPPVILSPYGAPGVFGNNATDLKIYVPTESVEAYKSAEDWSEYSENIVGYNFEE